MTLQTSELVRFLPFHFIIKFSYNARTDWLKRCTLSGYRCMEELSLHRPDQFPNVSLRFCLDPDIFFDLEKESENEILAWLNLERPVSNSTNCTAIESEISVQVTDENTEPKSKLNNKTNNQRFVNKSSASNKLLQSQKKIEQARKTKKTPKTSLPAIPEADLQKLKTSNAIQQDNPVPIWVEGHSNNSSQLFSLESDGCKWFAKHSILWSTSHKL